MTHGRGQSPYALVHFDTADLFDILRSCTAPLMEIELLRVLTGETRMPSSRKRLFTIHFSLYHALYRLKEEAGTLGFYLHMDPMRIRLARLPGRRRCHHYIEASGDYCAMVSDNGLLCDIHVMESGNALPSFDPLRDFYTNPENISFGGETILEKLMKGVIVYALKSGEIESALTFFGLRRPNLKRVKQRYHELARVYHPDLNRGDDSMMKELNRSYQVLMEVYVI